MPLTPADVSNKLFGKEFRGYAMDEVDGFLDQVEAELRRLLAETAELQQRTSVPAPPAVAATPDQAPPGQQPTPAAMAPIAAGESQDAALRTLLMAQRTADQAIAEARAEGDVLLTQARQRAGQIDQEVNARTAAALAELDGRRQDLEKRIDDLRLFEREYRLRLKAYLESQLRDLDTRGGGGADDAGTGVPPAARAAAVGVVPGAVADSAAARPARPPSDQAPSAPARPPSGQPPSAPAQPPSTPAPAGPPAPRPAAEAAPAAGPDRPTAAPSDSGPARPTPAGPPREAPVAPRPTQPAPPSGPPRSTPPAPPGGGEPVGPFTSAPSISRVEQVDDGPEPAAQP